MANKQYRLTEVEWHLIQEIRAMNLDTFLDIVIALRNESRELEKKAEVVHEAQKNGWEDEYGAIKQRIRLLSQFEHDLRKARPMDHGK
ncbi:hypothetical protein ACAF76_016300 [Brevibacillus sp. TJ4]|uniref:hypothetical protein n=1 Tax=Brevibacillus sp. TJ4 TaxID=3234853 RepID=UPI0037D39F28